MLIINKKNQQKGFTLIEMLLVVTIIALIAAIAFPGLGRIRQTSRDARRMADLSTVQTMLETYHTVRGQYPAPASWDVLTACLIAANPTLECPFLGINAVPADPLRGRTYSYAVSGDRLTYILHARLETNHSSLANDIDTVPGGITFGTPGCVDATPDPFNLCLGN